MAMAVRRGTVTCYILLIWYGMWVSFKSTFLLQLPAVLFEDWIIYLFTILWENKKQKRYK